MSEEPVFEAVTGWVKSDEESRCVHLPSLLRYVRLPLLSAKYITDVVDEEVSVNSQIFLIIIKMSIVAIKNLYVVVPYK